MLDERHPASASNLDSIEVAVDVRPLGQMLIHSARRFPDNEALVFPGARQTYSELLASAWSVAGSLVGLGIRPGEHVGLLMTNHPDLVAAYYATVMIGAVAVPINARYRTSELAFLARDADLAALLTHDSAAERVDFAAILAEVLPGLADAADPRSLSLEVAPSLRSVVMMGASSPAGMIDRSEFDRLAASADPALLRHYVEAVPLRSVALILYTSGTTSQPRGAMITHEAFARIWTTTAARWGTTAADRHWTALPLFHVTALGCMTWVLSTGATFLSDYHVDAERALWTIEEERVTEFYPAYPAVMEDITGHPRFASADFGSVRVFLNVAPPVLLARFQDRIPHAIQRTTYGMTEGGPVTLTRLDDPLATRLGTCGDPQSGIEVAVRDEEGRDLPPGERGEIHFRGYNAFSGYYGDPEKTAATLLEGGWVRTGDVGILDADGHLSFLGRTKESLKVGGENVGPQEIEARLMAHPAVKFAQVVGMPDARLDEVPAAFVELTAGFDVSEHQLIDHCRGHIASFKVPRLIRFIGDDEWPMSATKVQRFRLRDRLLAELGQEPGA
jgi:acyl-CoA synthetase (AMP-forming)/AMP-acid ligase II